MQKNFEEAKAYFATLEVNIQKAFQELGSCIVYSIQYMHNLPGEKLPLVGKVFSYADGADKAIH